MSSEPKTPTTTTTTPITCPRCQLSFELTGTPANGMPSPESGSGTVIVEPGPFASVTPTLPGPALPDRIGRFQIQRFLGEGAFGRVYEAYDPSLKRLIALKVARPERMASVQMVQRFQREGQAAAGLLHPHIVAVFDSGSDGPFHYIACAFIAGQPLDSVLLGLSKGQPLPLPQAVRIVQRLAEALAYAHKQGVIHRDVKPANVMLTEAGEPLLMDFGLAARSDEAERLTQLGNIMGTPQYMAPEQWRGQAEPTSDQYSLGCLLFELLTGRLPFVGGSTEHYLLLHTQQAAPSPRTLNPVVPHDLEIICLKCLEKEPGQRYPDCQALADDLRRFLEGEPISARPLGPAERLRRWVRKYPMVAGLSAALLLLLVTGTGLVTWQWQQAVAALARADQEQKQRALAQVNALRDAAPGAVPAILADLQANRDQVLPRLHELWQQEDIPPAAHLRLALALLPVKPEEVREPLRDWMLRADDPAEVLLVRDALSPHAGDLSESLWQLAEEGKVPAAQRFRALVALASFDPSSERWARAAPLAVGQMVSADPLHLGQWAAGLRPVRQALLGPLSEVFRGQRLPELRLTAATVLADYAADQPGVLVGLVVDAEPKQYALLRPLLEKHRVEAVRSLRQILLKREGASPPVAADRRAGALPLQPPLKREGASPPVAADRRAGALPLQPGESERKDRPPLPRQQALAAVALLHLGESEPVWPLFRLGPDPEARSQLVWHVGLLGVDPRLLKERLEQEKDLTARRALIVSLGEYTAEQLPAEVRQPLTEKLLDWYQNDPDPGIHGAIDWLLRHGKEGPNPRPLDWGQTQELLRLDADPKCRDPAGRRWYVTSQGQTMVLVPGPVEFRMGSPPSEPRRQNGETLHQRKIDRGFAIASKPVTVAQFKEFLKENEIREWLTKSKEIEEWSPNDGGPIIKVTWYEAARYCNWLSKKERIPKEHWCYPDKIEAGMKPYPDYLKRQGYRLPTEAEWEYACRANTLSSRYYGSSETLLPRYAWNLNNSEWRTWPVGQKRPNDLGLFDMHGNVWNWCQESRKSYQPTKEGKPAEDKEDLRARENTPPYPMQRGGSWVNLPPLVRSARRSSHSPSDGSYSGGFRPARTCD